MRHIILPLLTLLLAAGCSDDPLYPDPNAAGNPDVVKFSTSVSRASASVRSGGIPLYEPLVLTSTEGGDPLYLHTFETDKIGFEPGDDLPAVSTRGMQVESVEDLEKYHKDFTVRASYKDDGSEYIEWTGTRPSAPGSDIWLTSTTRYWPGERELAFHAMAPSSEFGNLETLSAITGMMSFRYSARKGNGSNDAEQQQDLLLAMSSCNKAGSVAGRAPLKFHHALSAIKFAVRDVLGGEVVRIAIAGVYGSADCQYTADDSGANGVFSWSNHSDRQNYAQDFNYAVADRVVDPSDDSQDILLNDRMPEKTFMLIPQTIPDDAEIIITLKRGGMTPETKTVRARIKDNDVREWKAGHEYIYTISTSKDNWVYVLTATGNHDSVSGKHGVDGNQIYVYSPSVDEHDKYGDKAYFKVRSFRYRANNQNLIEDLPWQASNNDALQYRITAPGKYEYVSLRDVPAAEWIPTRDELKGNGGYRPETHGISFAAHHQLTDWPGDKWMQDRSPYSGNSESRPWDLSTCGGQVARSTANCYVIDREGWYCFPLAYGNSVKEWDDNTSAYTYDKAPDDNYMSTFPDYMGWAISSPYIPDDQCVSAGIVWADVYNAVSDVELRTIDGEKMICFRANKYNLQQGNVIIALRDEADAVVWSWHIWVTEHWLAPLTGIPHVFDEKGTEFSFTASSSNRRQRGDVLVEVTVDETKETVSRYMAPYNLGWCDPKNVDYLRRPGTMTYVQYQKDGVTSTGHTTSLPIVQEGARINYKFGNTTYYQFGRKDPIVGFVNHASIVKRNFGSQKYELGAQAVSIAEAIKNPNVLYCTGTADDWCDQPKHNFWNNGLNSDLSNVSVKTVYDPCPAGYCVPPSVIFRFIGKDNNGGYYNSASDNKKPLKNFNGVQLDEFSFKIKRSGTLTTLDDKDAIWITSTGNRWYTNSRPELAMGGDNFNPQLAYLWSCTVQKNKSTMAYGIALGLDKKYVEETSATRADDDVYVITSYFNGRRSMARPVRPVREQ